MKITNKTYPKIYKKLSWEQRIPYNQTLKLSKYVLEFSPLVGNYYPDKTEKFTFIHDN